MQYLDVRRWIGASMLAALVACGGGGGGGGTVGGGGDTTATLPGGSVSLKSGAIRDVVYEGMAAHQKNIEIAYEGDVSALAGRTIYIKVVQPEAVYVSDPFVQSGAGQSVIVTLAGNSAHALTAGATRGTLQVYVCVDSLECKTQVRNSPLQVDYEIEVRAGLRLSPEAIEQSTNYGTAAAARTVAVTQPAEAGSWGYVPIGTPAGANPASPAIVPQWLKRQGNVLTFEPPADLLPGVYAQEFQFDTVVPDPALPSVPQRLVRRLLVSHTVVATGVYVATPSSVAITQSRAGFPADLPVPSLVSQVGGTFTRIGVRSDSHPAAADGHALLPNWLANGPSPNLGEPSYRINYCDVTQFPVVCLPDGTYRGVQLMRHTAADGVQTNFEIPISFVLTP